MTNAVVRLRGPETIQMRGAWSRTNVIGQLFRTASERHGRIFPCAGKLFSQCFTNDATGRLVFWFNTIDNNTHIVAEERHNA